MKIIRIILPPLLRIIRYFLDVATAFVCCWLYGKPTVLPPISNKLLLQPATVLAEKIRKKELKCVELVEAFILRIKDVQPYINAVVDNAFVDAISEAKRVDDFIASGAKTEDEIKRDTPLLGVPFSCKEHIAAKGLYFTNGLYSRKGTKADFDAAVVMKMKNAGAILLVKTNVSELSMWWDCVNCVYGTTKNPYDTRRIPGGSSGGEGALIGAGASVIGVGTDIGGSLRIPAFMNGIFTHKPSAGVIPNTGTYPSVPESIGNVYSCMGPMCRYATDLRPMMKILSVPKKVDLDKTVVFSRLKIYYCEDDGGNPVVTPVHPDIKAALRKAVLYFEEKYGVIAKRVQIDNLKDAPSMWIHVLSDAGLSPIEVTLGGGQGTFNLGWELFKWCLGISKHTTGSLFMATFRKYLPGKGSTIRQETLKAFQQMRAQFNDLLKENCVFLYPTHPEPAPYHRETILKCYNATYTSVFNILGFPATHIPLGLSKGLPIGIQAVANSLEDHLTIAVAEELERGFGGWTSPSPLL